MYIIPPFSHFSVLYIFFLLLQFLTKQSETNNKIVETKVTKQDGK